MSTGDITSANSQVTLTVTSLYDTPIALSNFSADRAWESEDLESAETQLSMDGNLAAGWIPNVVNQTFTLLPDSDSFFLIENVQLAQRAKRQVMRWGGIITIPSIGRKYTMNRGVLMGTNILPNAGRVLEARHFTIRWESVEGVPI